MELATIDTVAPTRSTEPPPRVQRDLARLREAAGQALGSVFFGTLLKTMRESSLKGQYGHGGRGEEAFSSQLHNIYAERIGTSVQTGMTEAIYKRLARQQELISTQRKLG